MPGQIAHQELFTLHYPYCLTLNLRSVKQIGFSYYNDDNFKLFLTAKTLVSNSLTLPKNIPEKYLTGPVTSIH